MLRQIALVAALLFWGSPLLAQPDAAALAQRAKEAMAERRFDAAVAMYAELVRALPADAAMRMNLGIALSMAGRVPEAMAPLEKAVTLEPGLMSAWLFLGANLLELGEPSRAADALRKVVASEPENVRAHELLGEALLALEGSQDAASEFRAVVDRDQSSARGWYGLGRSFEALAREAFRELEQAGDESPYVLTLRADALAASRDYAQAIELYKLAVARREDLREARTALAETYDRAGDASAATTVRDSLQREQTASLHCADTAEPSAGRQAGGSGAQAGAGRPSASSGRAEGVEGREAGGSGTEPSPGREPGGTRSSPTPLRPLVECDYLAGRYDSVVRIARTRSTPEAQYWLTRSYNELAREAFAKLATLPASPELHQFRAERMHQQGRDIEAAAELRRALEMVPGDLGLQMRLAMLLYATKSYTEAVELLEVVTKRDRSADALFLLGDSLLAVGRSPEAVTALEAAHAAAPGAREIQASLGRAYVQAGNPAAAVPHLEAALSTDTDGSLHYQLARAYQATGRAELAKRMLDRYAAMQNREP